MLGGAFLVEVDVGGSAVVVIGGQGVAVVVEGFLAGVGKGLGFVVDVGLADFSGDVPAAVSLEKAVAFGEEGLVD